MLELKAIKIKKPEDTNIILGQAHFIKTVEDLYEVVVGSVPGIKFGLGFSESSGACLARSEGNDEELKKIAEGIVLELSCGHIFVIVLRNAYPINILNAIKSVPEVCSIFCATANAIEVVVAETEQGRGILGVIDGLRPKGIETKTDITWRKDLLRKINYKR